MSWPRVGKLIAILSLATGCMNVPAERVTEQVFAVGMHGAAADATYPDLGRALAAVTGPTHVILGPGRHVVRNPVVLRERGVRLVGQGASQTTIVPLNPAQEVFRVEASDVSIENLQIVARTPGMAAPATFGVLFDRDVARCAVRGVRIQDTGASAVLGERVDDCVVSDNRIFRSGDDGIQLRGRAITVARNWIIGYFDEAIDLAGSGAIVVADNLVAGGRIGITVAGEAATVVTGNDVADHVEGGMHIQADGGVVRGNRILNAGLIGYVLESPRDVVANVTIGQQDTGMHILGMRGGRFSSNLAVARDVAFALVDSRPSDFRDNRYCGALTGWSGDESLAAAAALMEDCPQGGGPVDGFQVAAADRGILDEVEGHPFTIAGVPVRVSAVSEGDREFARYLEQFLERWNPGYLSIEVDGTTMHSDITAELHAILRGADPLAIGLVRWPMRRFHWATGSRYPLWHLRVAGIPVAIVSYSDRGAGATIRFLTNGRLGAVARAGFAAERAGVGLRNTYRSWSRYAETGLRNAYRAWRRWRAPQSLMVFPRLRT